ncbi:MAG: hypothetical protein Q4C09_08270, partial [Atopobiaceae bacterium]|nr:hypothetical protein [Atopobiaceae bacterium]
MTPEIKHLQISHTQEVCALSRRSFFRLAAGSLSMLPAVAGGVLVSPVSAYGEENLEPQAETGALTIVATRVDQVCVSVIDIENGRQSARAIVGAHVKITSYFNNKSVEGTTDERGVAVLSIADLAEDDPKKNGKYTFKAYLEASASGYRIFRTGLAVINGGKGFELGTQPIEPGVPYPSRVSFDDWDVLYTNNEFCRAKANDYTHEFAIELEGLSTSPLTIKLMDNEDKVYLQGTTTPKSGHATITFKGMFLNDSKKTAFSYGGNYLVQFTQGGTTYEHPISLVVCKPDGKPDEDPKIYDKIYKLAPLTSIAKLLEFDVPSWVPILNGGKMRLFPDFSFPLMVTVDPFAGIYVVSLNMASLIHGYIIDPDAGGECYADFFGYKTKRGLADPNAGKWHPYKTAVTQVKDM